MTTPNPPTVCPRCGGPVLPIVYGLPGAELWDRSDRAEVLMGGCIVQDVDAACSRCGWEHAADLHFGPSDVMHNFDDTFGELGDACYLFDELPTETVALASHTIEEAEALEARAERLESLVLLADGLADALADAGVELAVRSHAARFATAVHSGADRAGEAADTARRTMGRVLDLLERAIGDEALDDRTYEGVLTTRLHVPIATSIVADAEQDAIPALRNLARLALAVAAEGGAHQELVRRARGILRLDLAALGLTTLAQHDYELWSATVEELHVELTGLLAGALMQHQTLTLRHTAGGQGFVHVGTGTRRVAVTTGTDDLLKSELFTSDDLDRLKALGWSAPAGDSEDTSWHRQWNGTIDLHSVTDVLVRTLVDVHGVVAPTDLALTIGARVTEDDFWSEPTQC